MWIATWNIGSLGNDYRQNCIAIQRILEENEIDILCLQECPHRSQDILRIAQWGQFTAYDYMECCQSHVFIGFMMGIAVFSKLPLKRIDHIILDPPDITVTYQNKPEQIHRKAFFTIDAFTDEAQYRIITGHGFPFHRYHLEDCESLFRFSYRKLDPYIKNNLKDAECMNIICGDFNTRNIAAYISILENQFYDVFQNEITRPNGLKTDAIFIEKNQMVKAKKLIRSNLDHFMLMIQL